MIPAYLPQDGADSHQHAASPSTLDGDASVWVCFECGHEDRRPLG